MDMCNLIQMVHLKYIRMIATPDLSFANDHGNLPHKQKFSNSPVLNLILCVCACENKWLSGSSSSSSLLLNPHSHFVHTLAFE